jgi:hypothetical protein
MHWNFRDNKPTSHGRNKQIKTIFFLQQWTSGDVLMLTRIPVMTHTATQLNTRLRRLISFSNTEIWRLVSTLWSPGLKFRDSTSFPQRNTNQMQLCNRIYYSKVYWRLKMFRAAHRSSSGALNCICSLWFICPYGDRPSPRLSGKWIHFPLSLGNSRLPYGHINQRLQIQFRAPDDERCAARNILTLQ